MTGFIVALRQTLGARGLNLFQCITCAGHFILPYLHPTGQDSSITQQPDPKKTEKYQNLGGHIFFN